MATKTRQNSIPSIRVDREFLAKLGNVLEREVRDREKQSSDGDRKLYIDVTYTLATRQGETISFERMQELLDTELLPPDVKNFSARVYHHNSNFVDISLSLRQPYDFAALNTFEVSSNNESALLKVGEDLKKLFASSRPSYHVTIRAGRSPKTWPRIMSVVTALCAGYWLLFAMKTKMTTAEAASAGTSIILYAMLGVYWGAMRLLDWLYPIYEFVLGATDTFRQQAGYVLWTSFAGLVMSVIGKLVLMSIGL